MNSLFRRRGSASAEANSTVDTVAEVENPKNKTPGKGRATPKRKDSQRRRIIEAPPKDSKEARKRLRERTKAERAERYAGMRRGDEQYLMVRDRGPVKRLVRDVVDARRNIGPWFFLGTFLVVLLSLNFMPPTVRSSATLVWLLLIMVMIVDAVILSRRVGRIVRDRFPKHTERAFGLYFYAVMRSLVFRKWRNPGPTVEVGDNI